MLHAEIDGLPDEALAEAHKALLQAKISQLLKSVSDGLEVAQAQGLMTDESIQAAILEHRRKHPYR